MKTKLLAPLLFLLLAGIGTWLVVGKGMEFTAPVAEEEDETQLLKRINSTPTPLPENTPTTEISPTSAASTVPLPTEEDIIRTFFNNVLIIANGLLMFF